MTRYILMSLFLFGLVQISFAQHSDRPAAERIKAYRVAVFTETLDLTPSEAAAFWPLYNEFDAKSSELKKAFRAARRAEPKTDEERRAKIAAHFDYRQKDLDLEEAYSKKYLEVLPLEKVVKIPVAERKFKEALLRKMGNKKGQGQGNDE